MAASGKDVSNNDVRFGARSFDHNSPLTVHGVRLGSSGAESSVQVHECGTLVHTGEDWNFQQVVSPFWRIYHNDQPGCGVVVRGRRIPLGPAQAVIIPERVPFDCVGRRGVAHLWLHFSLDHALGPSPENALVLKLEPFLQQEFSRLRQAISAAGPLRVLAHSSVGLLHLCLARLTDQLSPQSISPRLRSLLEFIDPMLGSVLSNAVLAAQAGLSTDALVRWFRRETGLTPAVYVTGRRIREACRRLAFTDDTIDEIAPEVGFADRHHFSRIFKLRMGCGPAAFRKNRTR